MVRKGMGKGTGKGYKNMIGVDKKIHSMSAKGIKQPQRISPMISFSVNNKKLASISVDGLSAGEIKETKDLLAYENKIKPKEIKVEIEKTEKPLTKGEQKRWIASISYQFGKIKSSQKAKELFNKNLEDLNKTEFDKLFVYMRKR